MHVHGRGRRCRKVTVCVQPQSYAKTLAMRIIFDTFEAAAGKTITGLMTL